MRKSIVLSFTLLTFSSLGLAGEYGEFGPDRIDTDIQNYFSRNMASKSIETFYENLKRFQSKSHTVESAIESSSYKTDEFVKKSDDFLGQPLPSFEFREDEGELRAKVGDYTIHFSAESLFAGHIYINEQELRLSTFDPNNFSLKDFNKTSVSSLYYRLFDLFISTAKASEVDRFEVIIISTVMAIKEDFDTSWCIFSGCRADRGKRNFDLLMDKMQRLAFECQRESGEFSLDRDIQEFPYSQMIFSFEDRLKKEFNDFPEGDLSCQGLVNHFHKEEIETNVLHRSERRSYFGSGTSYSAERNRELNNKDYEEYIKKTCQPFVELRNCLVDKHSNARYVHDREREDRRGEWRNYSGEYGPAPRPAGAFDR